MARWPNWGKRMWPALLLAVAAGCTVSVQPWTRPVAAPTHAEPGPAGAAGFKAPMPTPYAPGYPPGAYPPNTSAANESVSQLIKQLNETEDQRKALYEQVQTLKKISRDRDDNLQHASYEMEESTKQIKRTREEVRQFGTEMDDLRDRLRKLEEMRNALKPLMDEMIYHLEHEKDARAPRSAASAK